MTELIYPADSYIQEFDALITGVYPEHNGITLDQTTFYPGGGGQPADDGVLTISGLDYPIQRVKRIDGKYIHIFKDQMAQLTIGTPVRGAVNWERRYKLMRTHTAMHILCGVIFRDYGATVTGGNMEPLKGRMDFEFETMHKDLIQEIETAINLEVHNARPISWRVLPREEAFQIPDLIRTKINLLPEGIQQVRIVEILGLDLQADGGTHVRNTSEVGQLRITDYKSKGKINKRIYLEIIE